MARHINFGLCIASVGTRIFVASSQESWNSDAIVMCMCNLCNAYVFNVVSTLISTFSHDNTELSF